VSGWVVAGTVQMASNVWLSVAANGVLSHHCWNIFFPDWLKTSMSTSAVVDLDALRATVTVKSTALPGATVEGVAMTDSVHPDAAATCELTAVAETTIPSSAPAMSNRPGPRAVRLLRRGRG
jgi:hypothetical protein